MSKRTTIGKPTIGRYLGGDPAIAERLEASLAFTDLPERATHGFHTYPAGLHPDAARELIAAFPGDSVLDPFCGGGTVLVEALLAGRRAVGRDLSPTAVRVSRARAWRADEPTLTRVRSAARRFAEVAQRATDEPEDILEAIREWYAPHVRFELESLRRQIAESEADIRPILAALFSSILIKVSWRRSDTSAQRETHHRPAGTTSILFHKRARSYARAVAELRDATPPGTPEAEVRPGDARRIQLDAPVDLVLSSPPYPGTYDYLPLQHLRTLWMGDPTRNWLNDEIGARRAWRAGERAAKRDWAADTEAWMKSSAQALRPGGHLVVVIGDGLTPGGAIDTVEVSEQSARKAGLAPVARASVERPDHARETVRWEHVLAWRRN